MSRARHPYCSPSRNLPPGACLPPSLPSPLPFLQLPLYPPRGAFRTRSQATIITNVNCAVYLWLARVLWGHSYGVRGLQADSKGPLIDLRPLPRELRPCEFRISILCRDSQVKVQHSRTVCRCICLARIWDWLCGHVATSRTGKKNVN